MTINIERLTILSAHLKTQTLETFDLDHWFDRTNWFDLPKTITPSCHTCGCIAGDALMLFAPDTSIDTYDIPIVAGDLLGLSKGERSTLFDPLPFPDFQDADYGDEPYYLPRDRTRASITPQEAAKVVDHLIATDEVDWRIIR